MTEWSITRSAGASGLILSGLPPISARASRIVARSTTAGTPVKSCRRTPAGRAEGDLAVVRRLHVAGRECLDVLCRDGSAVLVAEEVLEEDPERERELLDPGEFFLESFQAEDVVRLSAGGEARSGLEAVGHEPSERQPVIVDGSRKRSRRCGCFRGPKLRPV